MRIGKANFCHNDTVVVTKQIVCAQMGRDLAQIVFHFQKLPAGQALGDFPISGGRRKSVALFIHSN